MTEDQWKAHARSVVLAMQAFTGPFVSPISYEKPDQEPRLAGTGSYIELFKKHFLLTNEHVLLDEHTRQNKPELALGLYGSENVFRMKNGSISVGYPIDSAIYPVPDGMWASTHSAAAIPEDLIMCAHATVKHEILFFRGYAQEDSTFHFENLFSSSTSYATQDMEELPTGIKDRFFFALHHSPEKAEMINGGPHLALPPGFSGSTVWNTRFVECLNAGRQWTPQEARVTGIVCRWRSGDTGIVVLRVEYLRSWLLSATNSMKLMRHL